MDSQDPVPVLMCPSCWKIQPRKDELEFELDRWVDPTTFMARGALQSYDYHIIDGYCDPCLAEIVTRDHVARLRAAMERVNA